MIKGHESHYGSKGLRKIKLERPGRPDINWHFQYAPGNNNGTSVEDGQIPQIYFCAKHPYWDGFCKFVKKILSSQYIHIFE